MAYVTRLRSGTGAPMLASRSEIDLILLQYSIMVESPITRFRNSSSSSMALVSLFS